MDRGWAIHCPAHHLTTWWVDGKVNEGATVIHGLLFQIKKEGPKLEDHAIKGANIGSSLLKAFQEVNR
jgi:hypothetical protein